MTDPPGVISLVSGIAVITSLAYYLAAKERPFFYRASAAAAAIAMAHIMERPHAWLTFFLLSVGTAFLTYAYHDANEPAAPAARRFYLRARTPLMGVATIGLLMVAFAPMLGNISVLGLLASSLAIQAVLMLYLAHYVVDRIIFRS